MRLFFKNNLNGLAPLETRSQQTSVSTVARAGSLMGFSLVEMMVVIAIFFIITAVILGNLPDFQNKASMDLIAQDIALSLRQAQVYSTATRGSKLDTLNPFPSYGIHFDKGEDVKEFYLYSGDKDQKIFESDQSNRENIYMISGRAFIGDICVDNDCGKNAVDIFFERPKTEAQIFVNGGSVGQVTIVLKNKKEDVRFIRVFSNGQVEVSRPSESTNP